jgi:hypothetical protein
MCQSENPLSGKAFDRFGRAHKQRLPTYWAECRESVADNKMDRSAVVQTGAPTCQGLGAKGANNPVYAFDPGAA